MPHSLSSKALVRTQERREMIGKARNEFLFKSIDNVNKGEKS